MWWYLEMALWNVISLDSGWWGPHDGISALVRRYQRACFPFLTYEDTARSWLFASQTAQISDFLASGTVRNEFLSWEPHGILLQHLSWPKYYLCSTLILLTVYPVVESTLPFLLTFNLSYFLSEDGISSLQITLIFKAKKITSPPCLRHTLATNLILFEHLQQCVAQTIAFSCIMLLLFNIQCMQWYLTLQK